jgi:hypothetical protein
MNGITALGKGLMDYAETTRPVTAAIKTNIVSEFTSDADLLISRINSYSAYRVPIFWDDQLSWGSSGEIACNAVTALHVYQWTGLTKYRDAALDAVEWICGRNPVSRIFITGNYSDYQHGTDNYSFYYFDHTNPLPGYLSGNLNAYGNNWNQHQLDYHIKYRLKYFMNIQNAAILEPCLPWQAEACYLLGFFASDLKTPGDINFNGKVDYADLYEFARAWLSDSSDLNWNARCELASPANNFIDLNDFRVFAGNWRNSGF